MKIATLLSSLVAAAGILSSNAAIFRASGSPIPQVVSLLGEMKAKIKADGEAEQASYDKFACWCEDTLARKVSDISTAKEKIEELTTLIQKLKAGIASLGVSIGQIKKDISANIESQNDATSVREKEYSEFEAEKSESEQCIGALEAAIKVLSGAGTGKKSFLGTLQEAQVLSVVAGVRGVLKQSLVSKLDVADSDLAVVRHFVDNPDDFLGGHVEALSAAQIAQNPYGDYAPQSTQIQGILKGMYDSFTADLEKSNAEESQKQKAFEDFIAIKKRELATLQATLETQTLEEAEKTKTLATSKTEIDDTKSQLEADEKFFAETKESCSSKATDWAQRVRLRTEEVQGITKAIEILSGGQATFETSATTLLQVNRHNALSKPRSQAFDRLSSVAYKYRNIGMAQIAAEVKTGGHFDKVIDMIDQMISVLRKEEQEDIAHRDRCEAALNKNTNDMEDLNHTIDKSEAALARKNATEGELKAEISEIETAIASTKTNVGDLKSMRGEDESEFKTALKADADAVSLLEEAIVALTKFYNENKIPLEMVQKRKEPEYTIDPDTPPETTWQGGDYGGRKTESQGILAILHLIKEDIKSEMKTAQSEDAQAQSEYLASLKTLEDSLRAQQASKLALEKQLVELQAKMNDEEASISQSNADLGDQETLKQTLNQDCEWVEEHFDSRREKRKAEIDGLVDAKNYLAGAEDDDSLED